MKGCLLQTWLGWIKNGFRDLLRESYKNKETENNIKYDGCEK